MFDPYIYDGSGELDHDDSPKGWVLGRELKLDAFHSDDLHRIGAEPLFGARHMQSESDEWKPDAHSPDRFERGRARRSSNESWQKRRWQQRRRDARRGHPRHVPAQPFAAAA